MKRGLMLCLMLSTLALLLAQETPVTEYFKNPGTESFRQAVDHLSESVIGGENPTQSKLYLMYILDQEKDRLKDELVAQADSLQAGTAFSLANVLLGMKDYGTCITLYDRLNKDYPNWSCPWRHKGQALYESKKYEAAEKALQEAIATNEEHWDAYIWLAKTQKELKKYDAALANLQKAEKLNPTAEASEDAAFTPEDIAKLTAELRALLQ